MGEIRVNDIIYGTSFASGVTCDDNETVQEKLSNAAYIDIENEEIGEIPRGDYLYTTDIIDNLESESDTHVLSAKQGKILNEKIENFDLSEFGLDMELTQAEYDNLRNLNQIDPQVTYFITDGDNQTDFELNKNLADFFSISKDYTIGDYCISNGQLYEFIEDKLAGDWDEDKVKEITIKDKIETLKQDLESCFQSVSDGKNLVASAITDKGVTTASDATFETMANNITNIKTEVDASYLIGKSITVSATTHYFSVRGINTLYIGDNYGNPLYVYGVTAEGVETYLGFCQYNGSGQKNTYDVSKYDYIRCYGSGSPCGHTIQFKN